MPAALASRLMPFRSWYRELRNPDIIKADLVAGVTVAMLLIPQAIAYAQLAGLPAYVGLYAAFLPVLVSGLMGSLRQLATGPTAMGALLTAVAISPLAAGDPALFVALAALMALMVGTTQIVLGFLKLGGLVVLLSHPVLLGFTNAAAIIIVTSQIGKIFGVEQVAANTHYETVWNMLLTVGENFNTATLLMAGSAFLIIFLLQKFSPKTPAILVAVILTTLASWYFGYEKTSGGAVLGEVPTGLPDFRIPDIGISDISAMLAMSFVFVLTGFTEAISISKITAARTRQKLDVDQLLIGQGSANMASGFFQGYPVSGSFSRTALNLTAGARTGFSSVVTAAVVGLVLVSVAATLFHLPEATLAVVVIIAVCGLINVRSFISVWKVQKYEGVIALLTFIITIFSAPRLEYGIVTGVLLSLGCHIYRTMRPKMSVVSRRPDGVLDDAGAQILQLCPKILLMRFNGSLFFANTAYFESKVLERVAAMPELRVIIIDAIATNDVDATGEEMLRKLIDTLQNSNLEFLITRSQRRVQEVLLRSGLIPDKLKHPLFRNRDEAMEYAWNLLIKKGERKCSLKVCTARDFSTCVLRANRRNTEALQPLGSIVHRHRNNK